MIEDLVLTGIGPVSAIGIGREKFASALLAGQSGVGEVTGFDVEHCQCKLAAEIIDFDVKKYLATEKGYLDRNSQLAFAAMRLAMDDAQLKVAPESAGRVGLCLGTCFGNMDTARAFYQKMQEKGPKFAPPFIFPHTYNNTTASLLAIEYGIKGVHANFSSGAAAGAEAIAYAIHNLKFGKADVVFAGGVEALSQPVFFALDKAGKLKGPEGTPGFILGEGACMLVLETASHAKHRGARILARISSIGVARETKASILAALEDARVSVDDIGLIISAANGSPGLDNAESNALTDVFRHVDGKMWAVKSLVGETVGAAGPLGVAAAVAKLQTGFALVNTVEPGCLAISVVIAVGRNE